MKKTFSSRLDEAAKLLDDAWEAGYNVGYNTGYDRGYEACFRDSGDDIGAMTDEEGDFFASDELYDEYWSQLDAENEAYEAERAYDEAYYDPFTRDVDWRFFR
jgi:hypothetical protein